MAHGPLDEALNRVLIALHTVEDAESRTRIVIDHVDDVLEEIHAIYQGITVPPDLLGAAQNAKSGALSTAGHLMKLADEIAKVAARIRAAGEN